MALSTWIGPALSQALHSSYFVPVANARENLRNTASAPEEPMLGAARLTMPEAPVESRPLWHLGNIISELDQILIGPQGKL
jgi:hypothetical protein